MRRRLYHLYPRIKNTSNDNSEFRILSNSHRNTAYIILLSLTTSTTTADHMHDLDRWILAYTIATSTSRMTSRRAGYYNFHWTILLAYSRDPELPPGRCSVAAQPGLKRTGLFDERVYCGSLCIVRAICLQKFLHIKDSKRSNACSILQERR